jgi:hypothetical protein
MDSPVRSVQAAMLSCLGLLVSGCGGGGGDNGGAPAPGPTPASYSVKATVSGLMGSGLSLRLNGGSELGVTTSGAVEFAGRLTEGQTYSLTISAQPTNPEQHCSAVNGTGTARANLDIAVNCVIDAPTSITAAVSIDAGVPAAAASKIQNFTTPLSSSNVAADLEVAWGPGGSMGDVLALDADGEIVLAAVGESRTIALSAQTTAVALTRFMMYPVNESIGTAELTAAIRQTNAFSTLVDVINDSLGAGTTLSTSPDIALAINRVIAQLPESVREPAAAKGMRAPVREIATPRVTQVPYKLFESGLFFVLISGGHVGGGPTIANFTPIVWQITTEAAGGEVVCGTASECGVLERLKVGQDVPGNNGALNVTLSQSDATREDNVRALVTQVISRMLTAVLPDEGCGEQVTSAMLSPGNLFAAHNQRTPEAFVEAMNEVTLDQVKGGLETAALECLDRLDQTRISQGILAGLKLAAKRLSLIITGIEIADFGVSAYYTVRYWDFTPVTVGMCMSNGALGACAESVEFVTPEVFYGPRAEGIPPALDFRDGLGKRIFPATDLRYNSLDSNIAIFDDESGTIVAGETPGIAHITARDGITGLVAALKVNVVVPEVSPASTNVFPGGMLQVELQHSSADQLVLSEGTVWEVIGPGGGVNDDPNFEIDSLQSGDGAATVRISGEAIAGTQATVVARCPDCDSSEYGRSELTVVADIPDVRLEYTMYPGGVGNPSYGLWGSAFFGSEGPQCIDYVHDYRVVIYNRLGNLQSDDTRHNAGRICPGDELGWWLLRTDGRHWGLVQSGGVSAGGRMETSGTITLSLPHARNPQTVPSTHTYSCLVHGADEWNCSGS